MKPDSFLRLFFARSKMMEMNRAKSGFDELIKSCVERYGFSRCAPLTFSRTIVSTEEFLLFSLRNDPRGYFAVTGSVGLRLCNLESILEGSPTLGIHINVPIHLLGSDRSFREWQFSDVYQLASLAEKLTETVAAKIIPFLNENSSLESVSRRLKSPIPKDWYVLTHEQRNALLAAVQWIQGDRTAAIETIDSALLKLTDALPKKRTALESLRSKLVK